MSNNDHLEIAFTSMEFFQNDGKLIESEFNQLLDIALRDGSINDDEKRILNSVLSRVKESEIDASYAARIAQVREKYNL